MLYFEKILGLEFYPKRTFLCTSVNGISNSLFDNSNIQLDSNFAKISDGVTWVYTYGVRSITIENSKFLHNRLAPVYGGVTHYLFS